MRAYTAAYATRPTQKRKVRKKETRKFFLTLDRVDHDVGERVPFPPQSEPQLPFAEVAGGGLAGAAGGGGVVEGAGAEPGEGLEPQGHHVAACTVTEEAEKTKGNKGTDKRREGKKEGKVEWGGGGGAVFLSPE
jgi:hypothetical protein